MNNRTLLAGIAAAIAITPAFAQVKVNDTLTFSGWATGSYQYTAPKPGASFDSLNLDAGLLQATITPPKSKTTAVLSVYYRPSAEGGVSPSGSEATLLDAYVSYAASDTLTLTAGKFLSNLGYESFYLINDNMISLANQSLLAPIPGYHEGFKLDDQIDKTSSAGFQAVDSLYQKPGYAATEGDGELKHNGGFEAYYTYNNTGTGGNGLQVWLGAGYESTTKPGYDTAGILDPQGSDVSVFDIWATYIVDKNNDQIAAEEIYKNGGTGNQGSNWLFYYQYNVPNSKVYNWFCISGEDVQNGPSYVKYSISPTYQYNANLFLRAQYSYTSYSKYTLDSGNYAAIEVGVKF